MVSLLTLASIPLVIQKSTYNFFRASLNGLFIETSKGYNLLVSPPGIKTKSPILFISYFILIVLWEVALSNINRVLDFNTNVE